MSGDPATHGTGAGQPISLSEAYSVQSPDDNRALYAKWADTYESDFTVPRRYIYPRAAAELLSEGFPGSGPVLDVGCGTGLVGEYLRDLGVAVVAGSGPVLDVGCGTGLVGEYLRDLGVAVVDGIDISVEMLAKACAKTAADGRPVYRQTFEIDLTGPVDIASDTYSGIISTGTFTHGHVGPDGIAELLRIARPGACCVIGVNASIFEPDGFKDRFERYATEGAINGLDVHLRQVYEGADSSDPNQMAQIAVFAVG